MGLIESTLYSLRYMLKISGTPVDILPLALPHTKEVIFLQAKCVEFIIVHLFGKQNQYILSCSCVMECLAK